MRTRIFNVTRSRENSTEFSHFARSSRAESLKCLISIFILSIHSFCRQVLYKELASDSLRDCY